MSRVIELTSAHAEIRMGNDGVEIWLTPKSGQDVICLHSGEAMALVKAANSIATQAAIEARRLADEKRSALHAL